MIKRKKEVIIRKTKNNIVPPQIKKRGAPTAKGDMKKTSVTVMIPFCTYEELKEESEMKETSLSNVICDKILYGMKREKMIKVPKFEWNDIEGAIIKLGDRVIEFNIKNK